MTDKPERFFVNEAIREQILQHYDKEVPYAVEVVTEEFFESEKIIKIRSLIMVERETQKGNHYWPQRWRLKKGRGGSDG